MSLSRAEATRQAIIDATIGLILRQGFTATTVDQICAGAACTKGAFFHHFKGKEAVGLAAIAAWGEFGTGLYSAAWAEAGDALDQLDAMLDIMSGFTEREGPPCTCVVGMMAQELAAENTAVRDACTQELDRWTDHVVRLLERARDERQATAEFDPEAIGWFLNSLWQGSMLVGKTRGDPATIRANIEIARRMVHSLFETTPHETTTTTS